MAACAAVFVRLPPELSLFAEKPSVMLAPKAVAGMPGIPPEPAIVAEELVERSNSDVLSAAVDGALRPEKMIERAGIEAKMPLRSTRICSGTCRTAALARKSGTMGRVFPNIYGANKRPTLPQANDRASFMQPSTPAGPCDKLKPKVLPRLTI